MNLFIDTNILLDFYHFSKSDIDELDKLLSLVKTGIVTLWATEQLRQETIRNRDSKLSDAITNISRPKGDIQLPVFYKEFQEYKALMSAIRAAKMTFDALNEVVNEAIATTKLAADVFIVELFEVANVIPITADIVNKANMRRLIGNPPGKKTHTIGDEINWEALLAAIPRGGTLHIVSADADYASPISLVTRDRSPLKINRYLAQEWSETHKADVFLYGSLTMFFSQHFPDINIAIKSEKEDALFWLDVARSKKDSKYAFHLLFRLVDYITPDDVRDIVDVMISNLHVGDLVLDREVNKFLELIIKTPGVDTVTKRKYVKHYMERQADDEVGDPLGGLDI